MTIQPTEPTQTAKTVLVFGSFDMLHQGHRYFLQRSRGCGQRLLVVLARDGEIFHFKRRWPAWTFEQRKAALLGSGLVDEVIDSDERQGTFYVLQGAEGRKADLIILGDGQESLGEALEEFFQRSEAFRCPIAYVAPHRRSLLSSTRLHQLRQLLAHLALLGAIFFWASSWILGKLLATSSLDPRLVITMRMSLLAIFFLVWQILNGTRKFLNRSDKLVLPQLQGTPNKALLTQNEQGSRDNEQAAQKDILLDTNAAPLEPLSRTLAARSRIRLFRDALRAEFALDKENLGYLVLSGLGFALYNFCFFYGLKAIFVNQGGILTSVLVPIFSTLFYYLGHKLKPRRTQILGLLSGLLGGLILMGGLSYLQSSSLALLGLSFLGDLNIPSSLGDKTYWQSSLFIGTAFSWTLITQLSSKIQESYSLPKYSSYTYLFAALWTSWGWLWYPANAQIGIAGIQWLTLLSLVFVGSILGTSLYFWALRFLRPNYVASFLFLNPIFILLMSWLLLSEPWTVELTVGSILAMLAIVLLNGRRRPRESRRI